MLGRTAIGRGLQVGRPAVYQSGPGVDPGGEYLRSPVTLASEHGLHVEVASVGLEATECS